MQPSIQTSTLPALVPDRPLLVHTISETYGIPKSTIRWNARRGFLKAFHYPDTPKIWRFWRRDVEAFIAARRAYVLRTN